MPFDTAEMTMSIRYVLTACALCWAAIAHAQTQAAPNEPPPPAGKSAKDTVPPATDASEATRAGTQEPSAKVKTAADAPVFSNGALAVLGAQADAQTVPAKYSNRNDQLDQLPIAGFTLLYLTDSERSEVRAKLASSAPSSVTAEAKVSAIVPAARGEPEPVPPDLATRIPSLKGLAFASGSGGIVVIINPRIHDVVAVIE
jgi:hypothetical protein